MTDKTELEVTQADRVLIEAIINDYHTTRLDSDYVSHILSKPRTIAAFARFEHDIIATRTPDPTPVAWLYGRANFRLTRNFDSSLSETPLYAHPPAVPADGLVEALEAIIDRAPERDRKWFGMTAKDIATQALAAHLGKA